MPETYEKLIDDIVSVRKDMGWTQHDLAKASLLTQSVIARIESKKSVPTLITLQRIVHAMGKTLTVCDVTHNN